MKKEALREMTQRIRLCIRTYFNLYGSVPSEQEMVDWLGAAYANLISKCMGELAVA